jgi:CubicO group peptidase (beta-lactamase class C family)
MFVRCLSCIFLGSPSVFMLLTTMSVAADLEQLMAGGGVPGLSIGIVRDGDILSTIAEGVRNATSGDRVGDGTVFEPASLTNPVFAYAVCS